MDPIIPANESQLRPSCSISSPDTPHSPGIFLAGMDVLQDSHRGRALVGTEGASSHELTMSLEKVPLHVRDCQSSPTSPSLAVYLTASHPPVNLVDLVRYAVMLEQALPGDRAAALTAPPHIPTTVQCLGLLQQHRSQHGKRSTHSFCKLSLLFAEMPLPKPALTSANPPPAITEILQLTSVYPQASPPVSPVWSLTTHPYMPGSSRSARAPRH